MFGDRTQSADTRAQPESDRSRRLLQSALLAGAVALVALVLRLRRRHESTLEPPF